MFLLPIALGWAILSFLYQGILRSTLCDVQRFRLFVLRDKLRTLAVDGEIDQSSFSYQHLEKLICRIVDASTWVSLSTFIELELRHGEAKPSPDMIRFEQEASKELRDIWRAVVERGVQIAIINSPGWFFIATIIIGGAVCCGWMGKQSLELRKALLVEQDFTELSPAHA
jgi:hypothetical protein